MPKSAIFSLQFTGVNRTIGVLDSWGKNIKIGQLDAAREIGDKGLAALKEACPVFRGNLRDAMKQQLVLGLRDVEVKFVVDDVIRHDTRASNPTPPSEYVQWVINGRGPVEPRGGVINPKTGEAYLVYSATPENDDWIYSQHSGPADPNDFVSKAADVMSADLDDAARKWGNKITRGT